MLLHRFIVPVRDNANLPLDREHNHLRNWLITQFGGYTVSDCAGGWRDDTGRVYLDQCKAYDVALSDDIADLCVSNVLARLACVFIDQKCFAHARIGEMHFHEPIEHFRYADAPADPIDKPLVDTECPLCRDARAHAQCVKA